MAQWSNGFTVREIKMSFGRTLVGAIAKPSREGGGTLTLRYMLLGMILIPAGIVAMLPPARLTLLGWLSGEPCFLGRPLSYWRFELADWRILRGEDHPTKAGFPPHAESEELDNATFPIVLGYPGKWMLLHRDTTAQKSYRRLRTLENRIAGGGRGMGSAIDAEVRTIPLVMFARTERCWLLGESTRR